MHVNGYVESSLKQPLGGICALQNSTQISDVGNLLKILQTTFSTTYSKINRRRTSRVKGRVYLIIFLFEK